MTILTNIKPSSSFVKKKSLTYQFAVPYCGPNTEPPTIHAVPQLTEELRYKPEGRGFEPYGVTGIFHQHNPSGRTMASNRNEYQEYFLLGKGGRCVGLNVQTSCASNPQGLSRPVQGSLYSVICPICTAFMPVNATCKNCGGVF
jgi:hypothetical protein